MRLKIPEIQHYLSKLSTNQEWYSLGHEAYIRRGKHKVPLPVDDYECQTNVPADKGAYSPEALADQTEPCWFVAFPMSLTSKYRDVLEKRIFAHIQGRVKIQRPCNSMVKTKYFIVEIPDGISRRKFKHLHGKIYRNMAKERFGVAFNRRDHLKLKEIVHSGPCRNPEELKSQEHLIREILVRFDNSPGKTVDDVRKEAWAKTGPKSRKTRNAFAKALYKSLRYNGQAKLNAWNDTKQAIIDKGYPPIGDNSLRKILRTPIPPALLVASPEPEDSPTE